MPQAAGQAAIGFATVKRSRDLAGLATLAGAAALALSLSACSTQSPALVPSYPASDGVSGTIGDSGVDLRNFLVVGSAQGSAADVLGVIVNDNASQVTVSVLADAGASAQASQTQVQVPAHGATSVGPGTGQTAVSIPELSVAPGADTTLMAQTQGGGTADLTIPVLPPQGYYSSITPGATPSGIATPLTTGTATPTGTASATTQAKKKHKKTTATPISTPTS